MPEPKLTSHLTAQTPLSSAIASWQAYLADKGRSPNTIKAFLSDVRLLTTYLPEDIAVGKIGTQDLNRYFEWMEKERDVPCSPKTLARRITATKSLFRWLHQYGVLAVDPAEKVAQRSAISPLPTVLTPEEYDAVLLAADRHRRDRKPDARPFALVYLLLTTGIKKSETLGINSQYIAQIQNQDGGFPFGMVKGNLSTINETTVALWWMEELDLLSSPYAKQAFAFLLAIQQEDGSWEESSQLANYDLPPWIQLGDLKTRLYLSAYATYWLSTGGYRSLPAYRKAIHILLRHQDQSGKIHGFWHTTWIAMGVFLLAGKR